MSENIDLITLAVVEGALYSATREMTITMERTCRSPVLNIARDYSNAIFDKNYQMVVQGWGLPCHLGSMETSLKAIAEYFGDDVFPGDIIYHNDPSFGNTHLQDMNIFKPIFHNDELVFWAMNKGHMLDTGGAVPGGYNPLAEEIYAEGILISPVKLHERGEIRRDVIDLILNNIRTNDQHRGDMRAQIGAVGVAERRVTQLLSKYGRDVVYGAIGEILDRSEERMRREIEKIPDGVYLGRTKVEDDGRSGESVIKCSVTVKGGDMSIAFESRPQVPAYINAYQGVTVSMAYLGALFFVDPDIPHNSGAFRPIEVDCGPQGTLTNAVRPAPCSESTSTVGENVRDAVCDALSRALPLKKPGGWARAAGLMVYGDDPYQKQPYVYFSMKSIMGGMGAVASLDGWSAVGPSSGSGAMTSEDNELFEIAYPIHVRRYELRPDSAGPGKTRGGFGAIYEIEPLEHEPTVTSWGEGFLYPYHVDSDATENAGFGDNKVRKFEIITSDKQLQVIPRNAVLSCKQGSVIRCWIPGGAGVGNPLERDPAAVLADVRNELIPADVARDVYGVALDPASGEIDHGKTIALRKEHNL